MIRSEGIDWDEIIATTQDDFLAGRFGLQFGRLRDAKPRLTPRCARGFMQL